MPVLVGCKLPQGIILHGTANQAIHINGMNTALIVGGYGITTLEDHEWDFLQVQYADFAPFTSKAIFSYGSGKVEDIVDLASDLKRVETGLEGIDPTDPTAKLGKEAKDMDGAPEDTQKIGKKLEENQKAVATGTIPRKATSKKDQAAALAVAQAVVQA